MAVKKYIGGTRLPGLPDGSIQTPCARRLINIKVCWGWTIMRPNLHEIVENSYAKFDKLADATRYLVNALFGQYGLVIIDADDHGLKKQFADIIEQDITEQNSFKNIEATNTRAAGARGPGPGKSARDQFFLPK